MKVRIYPPIKFAWIPRQHVLIIYSLQANKSKQQETQSLRDQHAAASKDQQKQLQAALEKTTELEQELGEAQKLADEMSAKSKRVGIEIGDNASKTTLLMPVPE